MSKTCIFWFRQDLRLTDNLALTEATKHFDQIIPVYIYDEKLGGEFSIGSASKWWLHNSLLSLSKDIDLVLRKGDSLEILKSILEESKSEAIYFNRCYEPSALELEKNLEKLNITIKAFNSNLLFEPSEIKTGSKDFYKVFTPFWKACLNKGVSRAPLKKAKVIAKKIHSDTLDSFKLLPNKPNWATGFNEKWKCGENSAQEALEIFIKSGLSNYAQGRNFPSKKFVSEMSPRLHFGEVSPLYIFHRVKNAFGLTNRNQESIDRYLAEIGWREFSYHLLFHFPDLPIKNFKPQFDSFEWEQNDNNLKSWKKGLTGYPIVDAGMRELWHTGYMHNRVRMITASFLVKDLLIDWREGEKWFWDTLVDADLASNSASWQWVAGSGADAAPYFRIFNPILQSKKFDEEGEYIKKWVPELSKMHKQFIHAPWEAPPLLLKEYGIELGKDYPKPIVNHDKARHVALKLYKKLS